jgi:hypothetical protein
MSIEVNGERPWSLYRRSEEMQARVNQVDEDVRRELVREGTLRERELEAWRRRSAPCCAPSR